MDVKINLLFSFLCLFYCASAFNITQLLGQYPDFSTFNNYLTQTQLASEINSRRTITVLVVDNGNISPLSGKPVDVIKKILSVHVILDYYDVKKLQSLPNKTDILTTLFQSSGQATGQQGFLNATDVSTGSVVIGSAVKGATQSADLIKSVASQPYNVSVLQISNAIIPTGIEYSTAKSPAASPSHSPKSSATTPGKAPAPSDATAPATADAPGSLSDAPTASAPGSPPKPDTPNVDAPGADAPGADNSPPSASKSLRLSLHVAIIISFSWFSCFCQILMI